MLHTFTISGKVHLVWIGNQWRAQHKEECWKWHCFKRRLNKLGRHQKGCTLEEKKTKKENPMQVLVIADETIWTPATINIIQHKHQTTQSLHNDCDSRYRQLPHNYCDSRYRKHSLRTTVTVDTENTPSQRLWQSIQTTLPHNDCDSWYRQHSLTTLWQSIQTTLPQDSSSLENQQKGALTPSLPKNVNFFFFEKTNQSEHRGTCYSCCFLPSADQRKWNLGGNKSN